MTSSGMAFRPEGHDGLGLGALLALLAHALLVIALALGVSWRTQNHAVAEAEMWAEVPQAAAPQAAPPPPPVPAQPAPETPPEVAPPEPQAPPPMAEIAQAPEPKVKHKEKKEKKEKVKKVREPVETFIPAPPVPPKSVKKPAPAVVPPATPPVSSAEREAQRKANLQRMMNDLGGLGQSNRSASPSASYGGKLRARVLPNIVFTGTVSGNPTTFVEIRCAPDGRILSRRLLESSGATDWDNAVLRGIDKTESLPLDENGRLPDTVFQIGFSPRDR